MKTFALAALAVLCLGTSAFAIEKYSVVAPEPIDHVVCAAPDVAKLPEGLRTAVLWAWFLTQNPGQLTVFDLAHGIRLIEAELRRYTS